MKTPEPYVDAKPIAVMLTVTREHVLKLALLNKIPAYPLPNSKVDGKRSRWRFRISEIEKWMRDRRKNNR